MMELIVDKEVKIFDITTISCGALMFARHQTWTKGKCGFISSVTENKIIIQYHPGIGNITNHIIIPVKEVVNGEWEIRYSPDLKEVWEVPMKEESL